MNQWDREDWVLFFMAVFLTGLIVGSIVWFFQ